MSISINELNLSLNSMPWHAKVVLNLLNRLEYGQLEIETPSNEILFFYGKQDGHHAHIKIYDWAVCERALKSGDIGFCEAYIDQLWDSKDLLALLRLLLQNRRIIERVIYGSWWGRLTYQIKHWLNRNSKAGSKKNIHAHYDIGNSFYSLWLDPSMTYSSALFKTEDETLIQAQINKYQRIIDEIGISKEDRLLEIGCGWGGMMEVATQQGIRIDCLTISQEQAKFAQERAERIHQTERAQILIRDYRDHADQYDGIASIEMFEAVGEQYWDTYFKTVYQCLKPGKKACIQTIVIADDLFERYREGTDFIQQYVFPGGMLPSVQAFSQAAQKAGLIVTNTYSFGQDYFKTLCLWHKKFMANLDTVKHQGFDDSFVRLWSMYLMYCAAGFAENSINVAQLTLMKPNHAAE
jgi:cyclopropane-fatty-acyl-phospholipid synthase